MMDDTSEPKWEHNIVRPQIGKVPPPRNRRVYQWEIVSDGETHTIRGQMGNRLNQKVGDVVTTDGHYDMHTLGVRKSGTGWEGTSMATVHGEEADQTFLFKDYTTAVSPMTVEQYHDALIDNLTNGPDLDDRW